MAESFLVLLLLFFGLVFGFKSTQSEINSFHDGIYCQLSNCYFKTATKRFFVGVEGVDKMDVCCGLREKWTVMMKSDDDDERRFQCDQIFDVGFVFDVGGTRSHVQLHQEMALPLFVVLHQGGGKKRVKGVVLMPGVQEVDGKATDWDTDAFLDDDTYSMQLLQTISQPYRVLPLDRRLAAMQKIMCFRQLMFGLPKVNYTQQLIQDYLNFVYQKLNLTFEQTSKKPKPLLGIINNQDNDNDDDNYNIKKLLESSKIAVDFEFVQLKNLTFLNQVKTMQKYDVLVGSMNRGFVPGLYLPPKSLLINILPEGKNSQVNFVLSKRGKYFELNYQNVSSQFIKLLQDNLSS